MRTTINLDERVLALGRALAASKSISLGQAISDLVLESLAHEPPAPQGFPSFPAVPGHIITDELVAEHRDD